MIERSAWKTCILRILHSCCLSSYGFGFSNFSLGGEGEQNERFMAKFRRASPNDCINLIFTIHAQNDLTISVV